MRTELVVLFAHWCPKCNMMMPIVDEMEKDYGETLTVRRIDIEKQIEIAKDYSIQIIPTFVIIREKQEVGRMSGMIDEKMFRERMEKIMNG